jgi:orotate phosphoribosyltransferase
VGRARRSSRRRGLRGAGLARAADGQLLATLLLADTLRREGARRVVALLPYIGYARQDRAQPARSFGAAWAGALLAGVGVDEVVTVDIHSSAAQACFPVPVISPSPAPLFAAELRRGSLAGLTVVAPDEGAIERCQGVADAAGVAAPVACLRKHRATEGVVHTELVGQVGPRALIVDDILDTGGTLLSACTQLRHAGVEETRSRVATVHERHEALVVDSPAESQDSCPGAAPAPGRLASPGVVVVTALRHLALVVARLLDRQLADRQHRARSALSGPLRRFVDGSGGEL